MSKAGSRLPAGSNGSHHGGSASLYTIFYEWLMATADATSPARRATLTQTTYDRIGTDYTKHRSCRGASWFSSQGSGTLPRDARTSAAAPRCRVGCSGARLSHGFLTQDTR
jgi:hypothetical protein